MRLCQAVLRGNSIANSTANLSRIYLMEIIRIHAMTSNRPFDFFV